ncbi:hypothetical protein CYMTET_46229, partial [Cymbomonas tetramitiformis]
MAVLFSLAVTVLSLSERVLPTAAHSPWLRLSSRERILQSTSSAAPSQGVTGFADSISGLTVTMEDPQYDEIILRSNIILEGRELPTVSRSLMVRGHCVLHGESTLCTLNAAQRSRIFSVGAHSSRNGQGSLELEDLQLEGGHLLTNTDGGGAVFVGESSSLTMRNCAVRNCHVPLSWGGGIFVYYDAIVSIKNVEFRDNYAKKYGGAVYTLGTVTLQEGSSFANNTALLSGDDIYASTGILSISSAIHPAPEVHVSADYPAQLSEYSPAPSPPPPPVYEVLGMTVSSLTELVEAMRDPAIDQIIIAEHIALDGRALPVVNRSLHLVGNCTSQPCILDASRRSQILLVSTPQ